MSSSRPKRGPNDGPDDSPRCGGAKKKSKGDGLGGIQPKSGGAIPAVMPTANQNDRASRRRRGSTNGIVGPLPEVARSTRSGNDPADLPAPHSTALWLKNEATHLRPDLDDLYMTLSLSDRFFSYIFRNDRRNSYKIRKKVAGRRDPPPQP